MDEYILMLIGGIDDHQKCDLYMMSMTWVTYTHKEYMLMREVHVQCVLNQVGVFNVDFYTCDLALVCVVHEKVVGLYKGSQLSSSPREQ